MPMLIELLEGRRLLAAGATPVLIDGDGVVLDAIAGIRFRGRVGDFQAAPDPNAATGTPIGRTRWQATIHWGDDTPPELTKPKRLRVGSLPVVGTHTYTAPAAHDISVEIRLIERTARSQAGTTPPPVADAPLTFTSSATVHAPDAFPAVSVNVSASDALFSNNVKISPDGLLTATDIFESDGFDRKRLSVGARSRLCEALVGWNELEDVYPAVAGFNGGNDRVYTISFGGKQVQFFEGAAVVPETFKFVARRVLAFSGVDNTYGLRAAKAG